MSLKFSYDAYTITTLFSDDFNLSITASDNFSGDYFINEHVELTKIKRETIIATLTRKSEQQLRCQFNLVDLQPKKLIISIVVAYDFLPTFTELIELEQLAHRKGVSKVEAAQLSSDIEGLEKLISSLSSASGVHLTEALQPFGSRTLVQSKELGEGSYLFEISGYYTCSANYGSKQEVVFTFQVGEKVEEVIQSCSYMNSSYGYPLYLKRDIHLPHSSTLRVYAEHKQANACSLNNSIITLSPILKMR